MKPARTWVLVLILAIGALVRAFYLGEVRRHPDFDAPTVDAAFHDYWARGLSAGAWDPPPGFPDPQVRTTPYFRPPGYPYALALVYAASGGSPLAARLAQMALGLCSCLLAFVFARRWFGAAAGLILAALMATYWSFVYFEGELLEPPLLIAVSLALIAAAASWIEKLTVPRACAAGLLCGLGALVRPNLLLFAPLLLAWGFWVHRRRGLPSPFLKPALGFVLAFSLGVAPATVRNYLASGELVLITTNGGVNLYIGNNPAANGLVSGDLPGLGRFTTCFDYPLVVRTLEARLGRRLTSSQASDYFAGRAWSYIRSEPGRALRLVGRRLLLLFGPREVSHNKEDEIERERSPVLRLLPVRFPLVLGLAVPALVLTLLPRAWRAREDAARPGPGEPPVEVAVLVALYLGAYTASYLPFFVAGRYRVPMVPFLMVFSAHAVARLGRLARDRAWRPLGLWAGALALSCAVAGVNFAGYRPDPAKWEYDRGSALAVKGDWDGAAAAFRRTLELDPAYVEAYSDLGLAFAKRGDLGKARDAWEAAIRVNPRYPESHFRIGLLLAGEGREREAVEHFRQALAVEPDLWEVHLALGRAYRALGLRPAAAAELRAALRLAPERGEIARELELLEGG